MGFCHLSGKPSGNICRMIRSAARQGDSISWRLRSCPATNARSTARCPRTAIDVTTDQWLRMRFQTGFRNCRLATGKLLVSADHTPESSPNSSVRAARIQNRSVSSVGMFLGIAATFVFYFAAPRFAAFFNGGPEFVQRYFCGHPLEYVTSALFFVGMGILAVKWKQLPNERAVIADVSELAASANWDSGRVRVRCRAAIDSWQAAADRDSWRSTAMWNRVQDVLHYVNAGRKGGLEDHLKYLADLSVDRLDSKLFTDPYCHLGRANHGVSGNGDRYHDGDRQRDTRAT